MKYAIGQLLRNPGFTVVAVITLGLSMGFNTTIFTVLNRLMLQSLPFSDPASLVQVWSNTLQGPIATAPADFFDEKEQNSVFADMAAYAANRLVSYAEPGKAPRQIGAVNMTANFFSVLGLRPELGRTPSEEESRKMAFVCLISDTFWRQQLGADPNVIGRTIRLDGRTPIIIGVMPPSLDDPVLFPNRPAIFGLDPVTHSRQVRQAGWYLVVARMKPGVSIKQAQAGMDLVAKRLARDYPETNKDRGFKVIPYPTNRLNARDIELAWMIAALSGLVLLIACVNLANLQIVRVTRKTRDIAIRLALGCSQRRIIASFMIESIVVSLAGGGVGILVSLWSKDNFARILDIDLPLNFCVLTFTFTVSLLTALLFGAIPAWLATRADVSTNLKASGIATTSDRARHRLRQFLVLAELAMALMLLAGAGFFINGIYRLTHRDLGWDPAHEIMGMVDLDQDHFAGANNRAKIQAFGTHALEALSVLPGVEKAALSDEALSWGTHMASYRVEGRPPPEKGEEPFAGYFAVSPDWFDVYGLHLLEGRKFTEADRLDSTPVAIVDESMARVLWPGESALGKRIADTSGDDVVWSQVVGVVNDFKGGAEFYNRSMNTFKFLRPWAQDLRSRRVVFSLRSTGPPGPIKDSLRKAIGVLLPDLAVTFVYTIDEDNARNLAYFAFHRRILFQIAMLGLVLSAVGIYGVVANLATERTREIGIRMALGAQPIGIVWLFVRGCLILAFLGSALGIAGGYFLVTLLSRVVPILPGNSPWVVTYAALLLIAVATFASWLPALRTTKVNPTIALRSE